MLLGGQFLSGEFHGGQLLTVDVAWCPQCRAECTVEVVVLPGDPVAVAVCVDCAAGFELSWFDAGLPVPGGSDVAGGAERHAWAS